MRDLFEDLVIPLVVCIALIAAGIILPTYFVYKYECKTFAELQQTEFTYTINGTCYLKSPSGEWINKNIWYFNKLVS